MAARTPAIMLQGTGSDVGKSLLVAGLARAFADRGLRVKPFKPQNMSNNAAVTDDGGEIGRAQALQARAARQSLSKHMNPVLLKPETETGAQVVVQGKMMTRATARDYRELKPHLMSAVLESFEQLGEDADLILVEGAGSPAEVNLRAGDIANMGFADQAEVPVVLIGDIDRGGVIASLVGTHVLLDEEDRSWIRGYAVNKFRGDVTLFDPALDIIKAHTGWPCFGVVPFWPGARGLPAEDGVALDAPGSAANRGARVKIAVPRLARIANFDDFDPLIAEPDVDLRFIDPGDPLPHDAELIILPGTKSTISDLKLFQANGWDVDLCAHLRRGGHVLGICGGYQMLGRLISDPDGIEGPAGHTAGLDFLNVATVMGGDKTLTQIEAETIEGERTVRGYEIHIGRTEGADCERAWLSINGAPHGARSEDGKVRGCYLHGLFAADGFRRAFLHELGAEAEGGLEDYEAEVDRLLDELARHVARYLDLDALWALAQER